MYRIIAGSRFLFAKFCILSNLFVPLGLVTLGALLCTTMNLNAATQEAQLSLRVGPYSRGGVQQQLAAETPFKVELIIEGDVQLTENPKIEGLEGGSLTVIDQRSALQVTFVNGQQRKEQHIVYTVVAEKSGTFIIGPATVSTSTSVLHAPEVTVTLASANTSASKNGSGVQHAAPKLNFIIPRSTWYVGQAIPYTMRCVYTNPQISSMALEEIKIEGCSVRPDPEVAQTRDGDLFVIEWRGTVIVERPGTFAVPSFTCVYHEPAAVRDQDDSAFGGSFFAAMTQFMGLQLERKFVKSQRSELVVNALPGHTTHVCGVGVIESVSSIVALAAESTGAAPGTATTPLKVCVGDPCIYTLSIEGQYDPELLKLPELAVPKECKAYFSKRSGTRVEYIVHCLVEGRWSIAEQAYTFFNPIKQRYETFCVPACEIVVGKSSSSVSKSQADDGLAGRRSATPSSTPTEQSAAEERPAGDHTSISKLFAGERLPESTQSILKLGMICCLLLAALLFLYRPARAWWNAEMRRRRIKKEIQKAVARGDHEAASMLLEQYVAEAVREVPQTGLPEESVRDAWDRIDRIRYGRSSASIENEIAVVLRHKDRSQGAFCWIELRQLLCRLACVIVIALLLYWGVVRIAHCRVSYATYRVVKECPIYMGPGKGYPVCGTLQLDQTVIVRARRPRTAQEVRSPHDEKWVQLVPEGWVEDMW